MKNNIFDLNDFENLPKNVLSNLKINKSKKNEKRLKIVQLFKLAKRPLNVDELIIGQYRLYGEVKKRYTMVALLNEMIKEGLLNRIKGSRGVYKLTNHPLTKLECTGLINVPYGSVIYRGKKYITEWIDG